MSQLFPVFAERLLKNLKDAILPQSIRDRNKIYGWDVKGYLSKRSETSISGSYNNFIIITSQVA
jgi:hypothetical protein